MDLQDRSSSSARRTPWVRSWFPSPLLLYRLIFDFLCERRSSQCFPILESTCPKEQYGTVKVSRSEKSLTESANQSTELTSHRRNATLSSFAEKSPYVRTPAKAKMKKSTVEDTRFRSSNSDVFSRVTGESSTHYTSTDRQQCQSLSHFRSEFVNTASGPCPCRLSETNPERLRDYLREENIHDSAQYSAVHKDYGVVTKQCTSLRDEVDRLEASLGLLDEFGMSRSSRSSSAKEVRVVLYGDLGTALTEGLPKDSVSESLYAINVKLLNRLEVEKKKVEKSSKDHHAMTAQLEELVATVASFQAKFEERVSELHFRLSHPGLTEPGFERAGGTESGFGDSNLSDGDLEENIYGKRLPDSHPSSSRGGGDLDLHTELRDIVMDLRKVAQEISLRETGWIDEQKSWTLYSADLSARLSSVYKLVLALKSSGATDRLFFEEAFGLLKSDLSTCLLSLRQIDLILPQLVEPATVVRNAESPSHVGGGSPVRDFLRDRVTSWQEKSCQVENSETSDLAEIKRDHDLLEERYQSTVKRLQYSGQEKLLLESNVEKLKDELNLAQYEKEFLLKKNERSLMSLNAALSEKSAIESALSNVTADLDGISSTRWALESSNVIMRDSIAGLQTRVDSLRAENLRYTAEKEELCKTVQQKSSELNDAMDRLSESLQETEQLKQRKQALQKDLAKHQKQLTSNTCELLEQSTVLSESERRLLVVEQALQTSEEKVNSYRADMDKRLAELRVIDAELRQEREVITELRSLLGISMQWQYHLQEQARNFQDETDERIRSLTLEKDALEEDAGSRSAACSALQLQLDQMNEQLREKDEEMKLLYTTMAERDKNLTRLLDDVEAMERLKADVAENQDTLAQLRKERDEATALRADIQADRDAAIDRLLGQLDEKRQRISELERDIDRYVCSHGVVISENEKLQTQLSAKTEELSTTATQLSEAALEVERLQREVSNGLLQVAGKEVDFRAEIVELQGARAGALAEIDRLQEQLASNKDGLGKLQEDRARLAEQLDAVRQELIDVQERTRQSVEETRRRREDDVSVLEQEKSLWEHNQRIYSELIQIICSTILTTPDMEMDAAAPAAATDHAEVHHHHQIFTPYGIFNDDGSESLSPDPAIQDNDSGFVGSQNYLDEAPAPLRRRSATSSDLKSLLRELSSDRFPTVPATDNTERPTLLHHDLQRAHAAVAELKSERRQSDSLIKTVQDLTDRLQAQYSLRDDLTRDSDKQRLEISQLSSKVDQLTAALENSEAAHQSHQEALEVKEKSLTEQTTRLRDSKVELERVKDTGSRTLDAISRLNAMLEDKEAQIFTLTEEMKSKDAAIRSLKDQSVRTDGRMRELLNRVSANDALVADLSHQLRETELRTGTAASLRAKEEAQKALEVSLDAKIAHLRNREGDIRLMEQKLAGFVTDQLELANREADSVKKAFDLDLKETELKSRENDLTQKMVQLLRTEEKLRSIETDLEAKDEALASLKRENTVLQEANRELIEAVEGLEKSVADYETQIRHRDGLDGDSQDALTRLQHDMDNLMAKLLQAEKDSADSKSILEKEREAHADLQTELRRVGTEYDQLLAKMEALKFETITSDSHDEEVRRLQKMLAERSTQVATLGAEEKRLRHLLQSSEAKLTSMRQTFEDLEDRLRNKNSGRNSMDNQFTTLNVLYADLLLKYRNLSDAYDEMEIEMVRSKDDHRDVKRELDKLSDFLRRHLTNGNESRTFTISKQEMVDRESESTITKDMISTLRSNLEQLLQERLYEEFPSHEVIREKHYYRNRSSPKYMEAAIKHGKVSASPRSLESPDSADMMVFRGKVMDRLFETTSRENITREELLNQADQKSIGSLISSHDSI